MVSTDSHKTALGDLGEADKKQRSIVGDAKDAAHSLFFAFFLACPLSS